MIENSRSSAGVEMMENGGALSGCCVGATSAYRTNARCIHARAATRNPQPSEDDANVAVAD